MPTHSERTLTLTLYFEAVTIIMPGTFSFPLCLDLYNSFDSLLVFFHDLMNKWQWVTFQTWFCSKLEFYTIPVIKYPLTCWFQLRFGTLLFEPMMFYFSHHFIFSIIAKILVSSTGKNNFVRCDGFLWRLTKRYDRFETIKLYRM